LAYLLFVLYLVVFSWLVTRIPFFTKTGLSKPQLIIIFLLKVIAGIFYGWMGHFYGGLAQMVDTWNYHQAGLEEYNLLATDPKEYFSNLFIDPYDNEGVHTFFSSKDSYWNDLKYNVFIKTLSIFNIFSFGYYYVNVIFYAFLTLFGPVAFYRVITDFFQDRKNVALFSIFLVPSFLYWASGIHKEGLIFIGIGLIIYHIYFGNKEKMFRAKRWAGVLLGLLILFLLRNFVLAVIIPAIFAWLAANRWPKHALACVAAVYVVSAVAFFSLRYVDARLDLPQAVVSKQKAFLQLAGNSSIPIEELQPTVGSFIANTPQAITLSALRPYPSDVRHLLSLAAAVETDLILLLFLLFLFFRRKSVGQERNLLYFCGFFSVTLLLAIGFSVNNLGAIVRYRSVILPLVVAVMAMQTDWKRLGKFFNGKNKKVNLPVAA
jgi:hypothetical protein